jgi:hypothetical protein
VRRFPLQAPAIAEKPDGGKTLLLPPLLIRVLPLNMLEIPEASEEALPLSA